MLQTLCGYCKKPMVLAQSIGVCMQCIEDADAAFKAGRASVLAELREAGDGPYHLDRSQLFGPGVSVTGGVIDLNFWRVRLNTAFAAGRAAGGGAGEPVKCRCGREAWIDITCRNAACKLHSAHGANWREVLAAWNKSNKPTLRTIRVGETIPGVGTVVEGEVVVEEKR